jgi:RimJ/RimL family protein N-acetyltransferase
LDEFKQIKLKKLGLSDASNLSKMLNAAGKEYSRYFIPFGFDQSSIENILIKADKDQYYGIYVSDQLAGFYMLRGFDQGYEIPSYGVWVAPKYSGLGLASLTMQHAVSLCRINGIKKLMLKVHPENTVAKTIYEKNGFNATGVDPRNSNIIYHREL